MMKVYLISPGATELSSADELLGLNNPPLSAAGIDHAERISKELEPLVLEAIICGPMERHIATAKIIGSPHKIPVRPERNLRDLNYGRWCGKSFGFLLQTEPRLMSKLCSSPGRFKFPAGERVKRGWRRLREFTYQFKMNFGTGNIAIVIDDFVSIMLASQLTRVKLSKLEPWKPSGGNMTILSMEDDQWTIEALRGARLSSRFISSSQ